MSNCCNSKTNFPSDKFKNCCEIIFSTCVAYNGKEGCMDFGTYPSLNDAIETIIDELCGTIDRLDKMDVLLCFKQLYDLDDKVKLEVLAGKFQEAICELMARQSTDEKVKVSAMDTTAGYLEDQVGHDKAIGITRTTTSGDEKLVFSLKIDPASTSPVTITDNGLKIDCCVPPATNARMNCAGVTITGTIQQSGGRFSTVLITFPYTCTVPGSYGNMSVPSNELAGGVPVATATIAAGSFTAGGGNLVFTVAGDVTNFPGNQLSFNITVNGITCVVTIPIQVNTLYAVNCGAGTFTLNVDPLKVGSPVTNANGMAFLTIQVNVTQLGLGNIITFDNSSNGGLSLQGNTYTLTAGLNSINLNLTGTPNTTTINLPIIIGGLTKCTVTLTAVEAAGKYQFDCAACPVSPLAGTDGTAYTATINFCYINGSNGPVPAQTITGYWQGTSSNSGLTLSIPAVMISAVSGTVTGMVSGTPSGIGTVVFSIPGQRCDFTVSIQSKEVGNMIAVENLLVQQVKRKPITSYFSVSYVDAFNFYGTISLDNNHFVNVSSYAGYYATGSTGVGHYAANIASTHRFDLTYGEVDLSGTQLSYYYKMDGVNITFYNSAATVISSVFKNIGTFYNPSHPYTISGQVFYMDYSVDIVVPAGTAKITFDPVIS